MIHLLVHSKRTSYEERVLVEIKLEKGAKTSKGVLSSRVTFSRVLVRGEEYK